MWETIKVVLGSDNIEYFKAKYKLDGSEYDTNVMFRKIKKELEQASVMPEWKDKRDDILNAISEIKRIINESSINR